ncbi:large subunit ribosomal protein L25 [Halanaerobium congolense]|uniref:Large ribosomal subunit protein bL25 n=1 Tax=Halanaerobium congolense TaxID=54121 RepID=A0A4R7E3X2_9FIRM|nr:50S ribosomal protein L25/general stress protein Ctc [Halanaerobium congolense]KXS49746.1 MAG: large subunit ribosomal protein L25 [Halanaerobium sp. T82-1]PTX15639.1 LSU ribosomal protein L25P [Halanaerobium congolense]TDS29167.1 LSU ribosomal protein L25P [Halanaerobium congolense]SDF87689.1 large subunit ribosomal protein L25 [Halanaerobium congolense]SDH44030.1 large subunit ribosomal protein L25 [Halanaerobium congolense]
MERHSIEAELRTETGKGAARKIRRNGLIPGVVYGRGNDPRSIKLDPQNIEKLLQSNAIFDLTFVGEDGEGEDDEAVVIIKDYQKDVIKQNLLHVDFQFISMDEKITVSVPMHLEGDAVGVRDGGVLQQLLREIEIDALPAEIPEEITIDISELEVGQSLSVVDLDLPEGIDLVTDSDEVIVTVVTPTELIEEEVEEEEDEFLEPEVIGEEEEGEEGTEGTEEEEEPKDWE